MSNAPGPLPPLTLLHDLCACLRFYTRLPVPAMPGETDPHAMPDFTRCIRMLPFAGAIVGAVGALVLAAAFSAGLPPFVCAGLALTALVLATGAFHEDGLADSADGFGGGATRTRKLEIMKDSRIGTYGGAALVLSLGLRWSTLAAILSQSGLALAMLALVGVAAVSRTMALWLLYSLPPAREDGVSATAGRPARGALLTAMVIAIALFILPALAGAGAVRLVLALLLAGAAVHWFSHFSLRQIGGQTGDAAGAAQQIAEICLLLVLSAAARP